MTRARFVLRVLRSAPASDAHDSTPRFQDFEVEVEPDATVLDALELVRAERDPGLAYRHSCHHASCGTCGCRVNGVERLTCVTRLADLGAEVVTVEPLRGFRCEGDLVVDPGPLFRAMPERWSVLREAEGGRDERTTRLEDCIECGLCASACPVAGDGRPYLGPAALAAIHREIEKARSPGDAARLLELAGGPAGEGLCARAIDCSRVCPGGVAPARRIADLRRRLRQRLPTP
jgi:succinate dehydrogenase / fumarate reductase iron-sulfur subunit